MKVETYLDRGTAERFLVIDVLVSENPAPPDWRTHLDEFALNSIKATIGDSPYRALAARVQVSWNDAESRATCIEDQKQCPGIQGSRWDDVEQYAALLRSGSRPPGGPVFIHPKLTGSTLLRPIDGARRTMAAAETAVAEIDAVVIVPSAETQT